MCKRLKKNAFVPYPDERVLSFRIQDYQTTDEINSQGNELWLDEFKNELLRAGAMLGRLDAFENVLIVHIYDKSVNEVDILDIINKYNFKYTEFKKYEIGQPSQSLSQ